MSKPSARKKARRQKRLARKVVWARITSLMDELDEPVARLAPRNVTDAFLGGDTTLADGDYPADVVGVVEKAQQFERRVRERGWTFDAEHATASFVTWFFAPSAAEFDDDAREPVTRVWLSVYWDDLTDPDVFPACVNVLFVGAGERDRSQRLTPGQFFEQIDAIEAYRANDPVPALG